MAHPNLIPVCCLLLLSAGGCRLFIGSDGENGGPDATPTDSGIPDIPVVPRDDLAAPDDAFTSDIISWDIATPPTVWSDCGPFAAGKVFNPGDYGAHPVCTAPDWCWQFPVPQGAPLYAVF